MWNTQCRFLPQIFSVSARRNRSGLDTCASIICTQFLNGNCSLIFDSNNNCFQVRCVCCMFSRYDKRIVYQPNRKNRSTPNRSVTELKKNQSKPNRTELSMELFSQSLFSQSNLSSVLWWVYTDTMINERCSSVFALFWSRKKRTVCIPNRTVPTECFITV
jgi:hypothetical protein